LGKIDSKVLTSASGEKIELIVGAVVLLHDGLEEGAEMLQVLRLNAQGYSQSANELAIFRCAG
jgi:hypothetical protein